MTNSSRRIASTATLLVAPLAGPASGAEQSAPAPVPPTALVEYVEVPAGSLPSSNSIATKLPVPLQHTPALVGTVGQALIYEQDADFLSDALENVSGLNVQRGSGVHEFFSIRGFDSVSSGLIMIDGAAEPEVSFYQTYNVRGVEVFKGPAGFLYGKNPLAGAVNIARKQPADGDFAVFHGSFGSFSTQAATIDWNQSNRDGAVSFRLNGLSQTSDHYRDGMESDHLAANPSLRLKLDEKSTLNFNFEHVDAEYVPDAGLPLVDNEIPDVPRRRSYQGPTDFSDQTLDRFQIDYERRVDDKIRLRNKSYFRGLDWQSEGALINGTAEIFPGEVEVIRNLALLDDRQTFIGNQFEVILDLAAGSVEHQLLVGLEVARESDDFSFDVEPLDDIELYSMEERNLLEDLGIVTPFLGLQSDGDVTNTIVAPYAIDQMKLSAKVELLVGLRYDSIDVDGDVTPLGFPAALSVSRDDSELSPLVGIVVAPDPTLSLYVHAAQSYAPPSTRLVDDLDPGDREPERGRQLEVGAKKQFLNGKVRTNLALFRLERDHIAIADGTGFTQQSGDQRSQGLEIEVAAEPRPGLRTFFSYAFIDAELTEFAPFDPFAMAVVDYSGNAPIMAPEQIADLWVSKSFSNGFGLSGGARYVDEQFVGENNIFAIDDSLVLDAGLFFDTESWRFKVNLKNVTDEEYEARGIAGAASIIPADPFAAYAAIEFRLR